VAHWHDRQIETGKARDVPGMSACGIDDLGAAHAALVGLDRRHRAAAQPDSGDSDIGREAHAGGTRVLPVRHREIVGLQIAVARAPEDRLGRGGHQIRPAGLRARVVDQLDFEPGAAGGCKEALKLLDAGVGQRDAQAPDLAPVGRRAVMPLQAAEGRDRIHGEPDPVRRAADLANEPGRLRRRRGGERRVFLDQQHVRHTGLGAPIRDRRSRRRPRSPSRRR
jgi:hypothetical protein